MIEIIYYMDEPIWKPIIIDGKETGYLVSSYSSIKNKDGHVLKPFISEDGYYHVMLYINKKKIYRRSHVLAAMAFIPNPLNKPTVNHKHGLKDINHISNLEWATYSEQNIHAYSLGLKSGKKGETSHFTKYTDEEIHTVCKMLEQGYLRSYIMNITGISRAALKHILQGHSWKHIASKYNIDPRRNADSVLYGEKSHLAKINENTAHQICKFLEDGYSNKLIMGELPNISSGIIRSIQIGETWKQVSKLYNIIRNDIKGSTTIEN